LADVFISYSKKDHDEARLLAAFLEAEGYSVWWDASLVSGDSFRKVIMTELGRARAVVVIWTEDSINSDWVLSEAGRAHADRKLIPVKSKGLAYKDIPPPFDNMHIETIGAHDKVLGAVVAKLAEPAGKGLSVARLSKHVRYQLLSWFGIIGTAISLAANLQGLVALANWTKHLLGSWTSGLTVVWQHLLFFLPKVHAMDALVLTFVAFSVVTMVVSSVKGDVPRPSSKGQLVSLAFASVFILAIFVSGALQVATTAQHWGPGEEALFVEFGGWVEGFTGIAEWVRGNLSTHSLAFRLWVVIVGVLYIFLCLAVLPLLPFALLYFFVARMAGIKLNIGALSRRLWRVVAGVALIVGLNYLTLWIERYPWSN
jgi:hypothetical protein